MSLKEKLRQARLEQEREAAAKRHQQQELERLKKINEENTHRTIKQWKETLQHMARTYVDPIIDDIKRALKPRKGIEVSDAFVYHMGKAYHFECELYSNTTNRGYRVGKHIPWFERESTTATPTSIEFIKRVALFKSLIWDSDSYWESYKPLVGHGDAGQEWEAAHGGSSDDSELVEIYKRLDLGVTLDRKLVISTNVHWQGDEIRYYYESARELKPWGHEVSIDQPGYRDEVERIIVEAISSFE